MIFFVVLTSFVFVTTDCQTSFLPPIFNTSPVNVNSVPPTSDNIFSSVFSNLMSSTVLTPLLNPSAGSITSTTSTTTANPASLNPPAASTTTNPTTGNSVAGTLDTTSQSVSVSQLLPSTVTVRAANASTSFNLTTDSPLNNDTRPVVGEPITTVQNISLMWLLLLLLLLLIVPVVIVIAIVLRRRHRTRINQQTKMQIREYELKYNTMGNDGPVDRPVIDPGVANIIFSDTDSTKRVSLSDIERGTVKSHSDDKTFEY